MFVSERSASAWFFFHLVSDREVIRDEEGVNLSDEDDVLLRIARAVEELRQDGCLSSAEWEGCRSRSPIARVERS